MIDGAGVGLVVLLQVPVRVPGVRVAGIHRHRHLDEPHAALHQPPCLQAALGESRSHRVGRIEAVEAPGRGRLARQVEELRHGRLHPEGHLVVRHGRLQCVGMREPRGRPPGPVRASRELAALDARRRLERPDVGDRVGAGPEDRTLVGGRQETAVEAVRPADRHLAAVQDDEARQVVTLAAEPVGDPRAHARPALLARAGVEEVVRGRVLRERRGHRPDHRDVVHAEPDVREQVADRRAAGAAGPELPRRGEGLAVVVELGRLRLHLERAGRPPDPAAAWDRRCPPARARPP